MTRPCGGSPVAVVFDLEHFDHPTRWNVSTFHSVVIILLLRLCCCCGGSFPIQPPMDEILGDQRFPTVARHVVVVVGIRRHFYTYDTKRDNDGACRVDQWYIHFVVRNYDSGLVSRHIPHPNHCRRHCCPTTDSRPG